jgi:hypothetical protein
MTANDLAATLERYRMRSTTEADLHEAIAEVLDANGVGYMREYRLAPRDRIDFYCPDLRVGIEAKIAGGTNAVARQIARYCQSDEIGAVILVTSLVKHRNVPQRLRDKEVRVVFTGRGAL